MVCRFYQKITHVIHVLNNRSIFFLHKQMKTYVICSNLNMFINMYSMNDYNFIFSLQIQRRFKVYKWKDPQKEWETWEKIWLPFARRYSQLNKRIDEWKRHLREKWKMIWFTRYTHHTLHDVIHITEINLHILYYIICVIFVNKILICICIQKPEDCFTSYIGM